MRDELLGYYERELAFIRQQGAEFSAKYPRIASQLQLEPSKCEDPHVERLIEAFALLTARIRLKLDDEFPELTESLFHVLYPHYLAPIPSMGIVQFRLGKMTSGYEVPKNTRLYSRSVQGTACRFRTGYDLTLWPIEVIFASLDSPSPVNSRGRWESATLRISLHCVNQQPLSALRVGTNEHSRPVQTLRFFINGNPQLVYPLYELIFNHTTRVELASRVKDPATGDWKDEKPPILLKSTSIKPVGFELEEGMLPYGGRSFPGYQLLTEYFTFPEKFLFFEVSGLDAAIAAGFSDHFDIVLRLQDVAPPHSTIDDSTFQLGCTPIINLFEKVTEPIHLSHQQHEYRVVADVDRQLATEIYAIQSVTSTDPLLQESTTYHPFYSIQHAQAQTEGATYWYSSRRQSTQKDDAGTEVYLSLVDLDFQPNVPAVETLTIHALCTNRDLPARLPFTGREGDFEVEGLGALVRIKCLRKPTPTIRPPLRRRAHWRLISHLSLNHLSLLPPDSSGTPEALREILLLYDFLDSSVTRKQILGITRAHTQRVLRRVQFATGSALVRGVSTTLEFDEHQFIGSGLYLFASVLERFLGLYVSINSFNELVARSSQREGIIKRWPARTGNCILL